MYQISRGTNCTGCGDYIPSRSEAEIGNDSKVYCSKRCLDRSRIGSLIRI